MLLLVITIVAITWFIGFLAGLVGPETFLGELFSNIRLNFVTDSRVAYALGCIGLITGTLVLGVTRRTILSRIRCRRKLQISDRGEQSEIHRQPLIALQRA